MGFEGITEYIGVITEKPSGWNFELNKVSWNGKKPKYDIRDWAPDHSRMSRGLTLTDSEARTLYELLKAEFE